ncbi:MAG: hypothetical protein LUC45_05805 [Paraprevotella sp.]|nr:hypothetical protein [Paraprevotella sp.]
MSVYDPSLDSSLTSYAVFAADSSRVEVFRPSPFKNEILDRIGNGWAGKTCRLTTEHGHWVLQNAD